MGQTKEGAARAAKTLREEHGVDENGKSNFHKKIGSTGGRNGTTGGFYANPELARTAGTKGGTISRRGKVSQ